MQDDAVECDTRCSDPRHESHGRAGPESCFGGWSSKRWPELLSGTRQSTLAAIVTSRPSRAVEIEA